MKSFYILSLSLLTASPLFAQHSNPYLKNFNPQNAQHSKIVRMLLPQNNAATAQKSTVLKKRVIAESSFDSSSSSIIDTTHFYYSNNYQGSRFDFDEMDFDNTAYNPVDYPTFNFVSAVNSNIGYYKIGASSDSMKYWGTDNGPLSLETMQTGSYVSNNVLSHYFVADYSTGSTIGDGRQYQNAYDAQGRLSASLQVTYNGSSWDTINKKNLSYSAQGFLTTDTVSLYNGGGVWAKTTAYNYTRDASGNIIQIDHKEYDGTTWYMAEQYQNQYNASNQLTKVVYLADTSSGLGQIAQELVDSFAYTGSNAITFSYWQESYNDGTTAFPLLQFSKHMNAQSLPDSIAVSAINSTPGSMALVAIGTMTYDSDGNPIFGVTNNLQNGTTGSMKYYYETYNDPTSVANTPVAAGSFNVYPNPAQNELNIKNGSTDLNTPSVIRITNTLGQTVYNTTMSWNQSTQQIGISNLQPGMYWISIADTKGNSSFTQAFVKQ